MAVITIPETYRVVELLTKVVHVQEGKEISRTACGASITGRVDYLSQDQPEYFMCKNCLRIVKKAIREVTKPRKQPRRYRTQIEYDTWEGLVTGWIVFDTQTQKPYGGPYPRNHAFYLAQKLNRQEGARQQQIEAEVTRVDAAFAKLEKIEESYRRHFGPIPPITTRIV